MQAANTGSQRPARAAASGASRPNAASATAAAASASAAPAAPPATPSRVRQIATSVLNIVTSPLRIVGASPFSGSDANSPLTATTADADLTTDDNRARDEPDRDQQIEEQFVADFLEKGDGGDSDEEGGEINEHNNSVAFLNSTQQQQRLEDNITIEQDDIADVPDEPTIPGAPENWTPPKPPESHTGYKPKPDSGAPESFHDVDNPAGWCDYFFMAKYDKQGKYIGHTTPAGAKVLPADPTTGKREIDGWEFHYGTWSPGNFEKEAYGRGGATKEDLKPDDRKGSLCVDTLKKLGGLVSVNWSNKYLRG